MNREIKFRGKATQDYGTSTDGVEKGEWVYGYYYFCRQRMSGIIVTTLSEESGGVGSGIVQVEIEVDHKTVGQCTNLSDKNNKEIYEGDIVRFEYDSNEFENYKISWGTATFYAESLEDNEYSNSLWDMPRENMEVIGNVYENPELLNNNLTKTQ